MAASCLLTLVGGSILTLVATLRGGSSVLTLVGALTLVATLRGGGALTLVAGSRATALWLQ